MSILEQIRRSADVKSVKDGDLPALAEEIRERIVASVVKNGGHLSANLGVVELTVALHRVFDFPKDKLLFDVGHQCYAHKLLTGRGAGFERLRKSDGVAGFPKREESPYDCADTGHASTALPLAVGLARAGCAGDIVVVLGDGAMTGGMVYAAMNDLINVRGKIVLIINDNNMAISENVGYVSKSLKKLRENADSSRKFFAEYGMEYLGIADGHDFAALTEKLRLAKEAAGKVVLHVVTKKGKGYPAAETDPVRLHGYTPDCGGSGRTFSEVFGETLCELAEKDDRIFAVTAAMEEGLGLNAFAERWPERFVDTGITEEYAVTMCAGLALGGKKPYFAVYSTFLQRAFDNLLHDCCLMRLPVTICVDRAGIVPDDGETHQGIYDVAFLDCMPDITVICPKDGAELRAALIFSQTFDAPLVIRYPKGCTSRKYGACAPIETGKSEILAAADTPYVLIALGAVACAEAMSCREILAAEGREITVVNARFSTPFDEQFLKTLNGKTIVVAEDNVSRGGFGQRVGNYLRAHDIECRLIERNMGESAEPQGDRFEYLRRHGLDAAALAALFRSLG